MYTDVLYLYERNYLCVCFKAQESSERKQLLPQASGAPPKGLDVHWQDREQARIFKDIKWRPALPSPYILTFERLGKTGYFSWVVLGGPNAGIFLL